MPSTSAFRPAPYGDGWEFKITHVRNAQGLIDAGRIQLSTLRDDIKHIEPKQLQ